MGASSTIWLASTDNGDKPGTGIKLVESGGQVGVTFFLLDPNKPHDFSTGKALSTEVVSFAGSELHLIVRLSETQKAEFILQMQGALKGKRVAATLRDAQGDGRPTELTLVRQN